jgi:predicted O-linked N-acetylglucosamine transferase (SPINDLY family)
MPRQPVSGQPDARLPDKGRDPAASRALDAALAMHRAGRLPQALAAYRDILLRWPGLADAHNLLGLALYQSGQPAPALAAIEQALARDGEHPEYRNNRGIVLLALGRPVEAEAEFRRALAARPGHAQALANLGNALKAQGDRSAAMDMYRRAIEIDPNHVEAWFNLGNAQREIGDAEGAGASYRAALRGNPRFAPAQANLGGLLLAGGDVVGARRAFEAALAIDATRPSFLFGLALACERLGDGETAEATYRRLLAASPGHADALNNLAGLCEKRGALDEAVQLYGQALAADPRHERAAFNLGSLHARRDEPDAAMRHFLTVKARGNDDLERLARLGDAFEALGRSDEAIECLRAILERRPEDLDTHQKLGNLLLEKRETEAALAHLDYVAAEGRDTASLHQELGTAALRLCRLGAAMDHYRAAIERAPEAMVYRSTYLMVLNYDDTVTPEASFEEHRRLMAPFNKAVPVDGASSRPRAAGRRLRIGYVSPDFRRHSCANFLLPLLEAHDRDRVEIFCYSNVMHPDAQTEQFAKLPEHWRNIRRLSDGEAAALVVADGIDVLVDLAGHTGDSRLTLFLARPAPVQASWLGYPNTTGLAAIGMRFSDAIADPAPGSDALYVERLIRFGDGFLAYRPQQSVGDPRPGPALRGEALRFGCFNNANKISPSTIALWARILARLPEARLALRTEQFRHEAVCADFRRRFAASGVDPARIEFPDWQNDLGDALEGHETIDIALDPTPYNGTTTTCEALWMGVPVVTLAGDRHSARVGASLLFHAGLGEWVARTPEDYVRIALDLAGDRARLAALRGTLRGRLAASPVGDAVRLARAIEAACRAAVA